MTGSAVAVVTALLGAMRERKISLPAASTVEKLAYGIQEEARGIFFTELTTGLTSDHTAKLDRLLSLRDKTQTNLVWLKNFPRRPTPQGVVSILDRHGAGNLRGDLQPRGVIPAAALMQAPMDSIRQCGRRQAGTT
jgi:hypothetical protein